MLKAGMANAKGIVRLKVPEAWSVIPVQIPFDIHEKNGEHSVSFTVLPLPDAKSGGFTAEAAIGTAIFNQGIEVIKYKHIPPQTFFPLAEGKLLRIDLKKNDGNVGYIMGAGDEVPEAIRQMGYTLTFVSDAELAEGNLGHYDIIVAGVRAYNTRPQLRLYQFRLMQYVQRGGTYIVQYVTPKKGESDNIGPYPINISRDRVAEEDAAVIFLKKDDLLLTAPNKITDEDFKDWIQERGLSFADHWDARYDSLLSCHDKDEPARAGGLLMTKYGKGYYVYCAYALFRQLPAGVTGAYRLFANILSLHAKHLSQQKK
jgi:hypothetical protein